MEKQNKNHHHSKCQHILPNNQLNTPIGHIINLIQSKFISPYKLIYMIDQKQADFFKQRNKQQGCCSSNIITIPKQQMSKLQKIVYQICGKGYLLGNIEEILRLCGEKFNKLKDDGKRDKLEFNNQVEKFLIDKILAEVVSMHLFKQICLRIKQQNKSISQQIGLWATPATWYTKYPNISLKLLEPINLQQLHKNNTTIIQNFYQQYQNLINELNLLEKDGKFEQILFANQSRNDIKIINNPQLYIQQEDKFIYLKRLILKLKSLPFQINAKMNSYCIVSENIHISYLQSNGYHKIHQDSINKYSLLCCFGSDFQLQLQNDDQPQSIFKIIKQGHLVLIKNNLKHGWKIINKNKNNKSKSYNDNKCFMIRFWINTLKKQ